MIRGSVDVVSTKHAAGWLYTNSQKDPLGVEAVLDHQVIGKAVANLPRPDLASAGLGDGKCGFELPFSKEIDPLYLPFVQIQLAGTDLYLRRWVGAGFADYFTALYERYPRAGRSGSVYGGLWTDRTDAAAMLKGRVDIGSIRQRDASDMARFIQDGVLLLTRGDEKVAPESGTASTNETVKLVADAMFVEDSLRTMRTIFDDHPVAITADVLDADEKEFSQTSVTEDAPSPAECLGLVIPVGASSCIVEVIRVGHRLPEFLSSGLSRWIKGTAETALDSLLTPDMTVDRYSVARGCSLLLSPGAVTRVKGTPGRAIRVLMVPSRLSLLRFHKRAPKGELSHASGARIWL